MVNLKKGELDVNFFFKNNRLMTKGIRNTKQELNKR